MTRTPPAECPICKRFVILDSQGLMPRHAAWTGKGNCGGIMLTPDEARALVLKLAAKDPGFTL